MVSLHSDLEEMKTETSNAQRPTFNGQKSHRWRTIRCSIFGVGRWMFCLCFAAKIFAADTDALLTHWLNSQTNIQTWSADFIQTRSLKSLTQPLTASGHVWFVEPDRFRWELGSPPQTIAIRNDDTMKVIYPRLKRAEFYPLNNSEAGQWRDALALLQAGFPRNRTELESQFRILSGTVVNQNCEVTLQPKSAAARHMMPQIKIAFRTNDFLLCVTELQFADGSTMQNDFTNATLNLKFDEALFTPQIGNDFKIIEPLRKTP
jgi:outer membrane lipoprotein-sorting protein